ncbi:hypothetical protein MRX96_005583 [Rhipicephalus microplus]
MKEDTVPWPDPREEVTKKASIKTYSGDGVVRVAAAAEGGKWEERAREQLPPHAATQQQAADDAHSRTSQCGHAEKHGRLRETPVRARGTAAATPAPRVTATGAFQEILTVAAPPPPPPCSAFFPSLSSSGPRKDGDELSTREAYTCPPRFPIERPLITGLLPTSPPVRADVVQTGENIKGEATRTTARGKSRRHKGASREYGRRRRKGEVRLRGEKPRCLAPSRFPYPLPPAFPQPPKRRALDDSNPRDRSDHTAQRTQANGSSPFPPAYQSLRHRTFVE